MLITAENAGKKFVSEWIIRKASFRLESGNSYTFVGPNGSGKSTLIQLLMGIIPVSEGSITYRTAAGAAGIDPDQWYRSIILAAPYMEVIEEYTLRELIDFHRKFKPFKNNISGGEFEDFIRLSHAKDKLIRHFSSGMKQRLKLGLAFMSDVPVVFLDEPTSNLDSAGIDWYLENIGKIGADQLLIIGSNQAYEYEFCRNILSVSDFRHTGTVPRLQEPI